MNILAIFPHPDDSHLNAGGTLARWIAEGHRVASVCCTAGQLGTLRRDVTAAQLTAQRTAELRAADAALGVASTELLGFPDGEVLDFPALRRALVRCVRQHRPDRVLTLDPWARYEVHADHSVVGRAASEAAAFAGFPLLHPEQLAEGLSPHIAFEVWYMGLLGDRPNTFVNIEPWLDVKARALAGFEATLPTLDLLMNRERAADGGKGPTIADLKSRVRDWVADLARRTGRPVGLNAAEAFLVQRCAPGHFDNLAERYGAQLGEPAAPPRVL